jgi:hypothetical protein
LKQIAFCQLILINPTIDQNRVSWRRRITLAGQHVENDIGEMDAVAVASTTPKKSSPLLKRRTGKGGSP